HAIRTINWNHGSALARRADLLKMNTSDIPRPDVLIGSPPCTHFSLANRGGAGDLDAGLQLVRRFLWFVAMLKPRWWVMENVPRVYTLIGSTMPYRHLGIRRDGFLSIPTRLLLRADAFGVPQARSRCFVGNFPEPQCSNPAAPTLRD